MDDDGSKHTSSLPVKAAAVTVGDSSDEECIPIMTPVKRKRKILKLVPSERCLDRKGGIQVKLESPSQQENVCESQVVQHESGSSSPPPSNVEPKSPESIICVDSCSKKEVSGTIEVVEYDLLINEMMEISTMLPDRDRNEIYALLEAKYYEVDRISKVIDELLLVKDEIIEIQGEIVEREMVIESGKLRLLEMTGAIRSVMSIAFVDVRFSKQSIWFNGPKNIVEREMKKFSDQHLTGIIVEEIAISSMPHLENYEHSQRLKQQLEISGYGCTIDVNVAQGKITMFGINKTNIEAAKLFLMTLEKQFDTDPVNAEQTDQKHIPSEILATSSRTSEASKEAAEENNNTLDLLPDIEDVTISLSNEAILKDVTISLDNEEVLNDVTISEDSQHGQPSNEQLVNMVESTWFLLTNYHSDKIQSIQLEILKHYPESELSIESTLDPHNFAGFTVRDVFGCPVEAAVAELLSLSASVDTEQIAITEATMPEYFLSQDGFRFLSNLEIEHKVVCVVNEDTERFWQPTGSAQTKKRKFIALSDDVTIVLHALGPDGLLLVREAIRSHIDTIYKFVMLANIKHQQALARLTEEQCRDLEQLAVDYIPLLTLELVRTTDLNYVCISGRRHQVEQCAERVTNMLDIPAEGSTDAKQEMVLPALPLPPTWTPLPPGARSQMVLLPETDPEYAAVAGDFRRTCPMLRIHQILRVQNPALYRQYVVRLSAVSASNELGAANERRLYHGTAPDVLERIQNNGFNRSYCGKNGTKLGRGVYFAVDASYSAHAPFSPRDRSGWRYMYRCRVITGAAAQGHPNYVEPPPKDRRYPSVCYDSVVDNTRLPSMYAVFHDAQAYPEYLIAFS